MFAPRPDVVCWRAVELAWTHEKRIAGRTSYRTSLKRRALWSEASSPKKCPSCGLPGSANVASNYFERASSALRSRDREQVYLMNLVHKAQWNRGGPDEHLAHQRL